MLEGLRAKVRLFVDDSILYMTINSENNNDLELEAWESKWFMAFHPEKCEVLSISRAKSLIQRDYTLHGHRLCRVETAKYLGVTLHNKLSWAPHVENITAKANCTLGFLCRNLKVNSKVIKERAVRLYYALP